jgi:hypothetical protein
MPSRRSKGVRISREYPGLAGPRVQSVAGPEAKSKRSARAGWQGCMIVCCGQLRCDISFRARQDAGKQSDVCLHAVSPSRGSGQTRKAAHVEHSAEAFFGVR